jgi:hypothetical protein
LSVDTLAKTRTNGGGVSENRKEACKTYVEQTKLLVTLASAFLLAPAALIGLVRPATGFALQLNEWYIIVASEGCLVASVLSGYVVLGTIAGTQDSGDYDVFRAATRWSSLIQLGLYLLAISLLAYLLTSIVAHPTALPAARVN